MKKILIVIAIIIIAILVISAVKNNIIKYVVTVASAQVTGAPVHIGGFSLSIIGQRVAISGFKMYNPKGFPKGILVDLPKINVAYDLKSLLKRKLHLVDVEIQLKEMVLQKNQEGKLNIDELKVSKQGKKQEDRPSGQMPMQIDTIKLGIGRIIMKDYSAGREPVVKVYDINIHKSYKNITSAQQLAALILAEPMKAAGIQGAKIYGVATLAGTAVLPVAIAAKLTGKDSSQQEFAGSFDNVYAVSLSVLEEMGGITGEDKAGGVISANINSVPVTLRVRKKSDNRSEVSVSARKYLLPRPEIAAGVLYEISQKLK